MTKPITDKEKLIDHAMAQLRIAIVVDEAVKELTGVMNSDETETRTIIKLDAIRKQLLTHRPKDIHYH